MKGKSGSGKSGKGKGKKGKAGASKNKYCRINCFDTGPNLPSPPYCPYVGPHEGCGCCSGRVSSLVLEADHPQPINIYATTNIHSSHKNLVCCPIDRHVYDTSTDTGLHCKTSPQTSCNVGELTNEDYLAFFLPDCEDPVGDDCAFGTNTIFSTEDTVPHRRLDDGSSRMLPNAGTVSILGSVHTSCSGSNNVLNMEIGAGFYNFEMIVQGATSSEQGLRLCEDEVRGGDRQKQEPCTDSTSWTALTHCCRSAFSLQSNCKGKGKGKGKGGGKSKKDEFCCSDGMSSLYFTLNDPAQTGSTEFPKYKCTVDSKAGARFVDCDAVRKYINPTLLGQAPPANPYPDGTSEIDVGFNGEELCLWTGDLDTKMERDVLLQCVQESPTNADCPDTHIHTSCSKRTFPGYFQELGTYYPESKEPTMQAYLAFTGGSSVAYLDNEVRTAGDRTRKGRSDHAAWIHSSLLLFPVASPVLTS